jgi:phage terminase small subunit
MRPIEDRELTLKQKLFVEAYVSSDGNLTEAARQAGYKGNNLNKVASELKAKPHIKKAIDELTAKKIKELNVTKEYVLRKLVRTVEKAEDDNNHGATLRGLELLAKHLGMFIERQEISGPDGGAIVHEQKVKQDAADFASRLARLANAGGTGEVLEFPVRRGEGSA